MGFAYFFATVWLLYPPWPEILGWAWENAKMILGTQGVKRKVVRKIHRNVLWMCYTSLLDIACVFEVSFSTHHAPWHMCCISAGPLSWHGTTDCPSELALQTIRDMTVSETWLQIVKECGEITYHTTVSPSWLFSCMTANYPSWHDTTCVMAGGQRARWNYWAGPWRHPWPELVPGRRAARPPAEGVWCTGVHHRPVYGWRHIHPCWRSPPGNSPPFLLTTVLFQSFLRCLAQQLLE